MTAVLIGITILLIACVGGDGAFSALSPLPFGTRYGPALSLRLYCFLLCGGARRNTSSPEPCR